MGRTKIEWANSLDGTKGIVWNPVTGCTKVSEGCRNCYAARMSKRLAGRCGYPKDKPFEVTVHEDKFIEPLTWRKPRRVFVNSMSDLFHPDVKDDWILAAFVAMGLTYEHTGKMVEVSPGHKVGIYKPKHTFMILTKRPQRMRDFMKRLTSGESDKEWEEKAHYYSTFLAAKIGAPLPGNAIFNFEKWIADGIPGLWLGVSVENQSTADERIPLLLQTPAAVRFISAEPLLGPVDLANPYTDEIFSKCANEDVLYSKLEPEIVNTDSQTGYKTSSWDEILPGIHWVITGGETGPGARPMHPDWVRSLKDQCQDAEVPFFFKSWGEWFVPEDGEEECRVCGCTWNNACDGGCYWVEPGLCNKCVGKQVPDYRAVKFQRVGKKKAGRILDGQEWNQLPEARYER